MLKEGRLPKRVDLLSPRCWPVIPPMEPVPAPSVQPARPVVDSQPSMENRSQWNGCDLGPARRGNPSI